jgi:hypothetical protein
MTDPDRLQRFLRTTLHDAGKQYEATKRAYHSARESALAEVPTDADGNARIVCRRHASRRAVALDAQGRPSCFESDHPDCEGCVEDLRAGRIETW